MKEVLIIDDDSAIRSLFEQFLQSKGFSTRVADNGLGALLQIKEQLPDLIITDIVMDGMDGLALLREIRSRYPDMPIIAISGGRQSVSVNFEPHAQKDGANEFLEKPVSLTKLLAAVQKVLDGKDTGGYLFSSDPTEKP